MKLLHIADLHLRDRDIDEAEKCLEYLAGYAEQEEDVDLIVIAGDVFDSQDVKMESKAAGLAVKSISDFADIAPVAIVVGTPSHDGMAPIILSHVRGGYDILVADRPSQYALRRGGFFPTDGSDRCYTDADAVISLVPQPTKQYFQTAAGIQDGNQEIGEAMTAIFASFGLSATLYPGAPHILVGHFNARGAALSNGQVLVGMDIEITPDQIEAARADLVCLGHIHKAQQIRSNIFYSGSVYHINWGEMEAKGGYVHDVEAAGSKPQSTFIECPAKKMLRFAFDATADENAEITLDDYLNALAADVRQAYARLDITVWQDQAREIDKDKLRRFFLAGGALDLDIRIVRVPRHNVRAEAVLKAERLRDKIRRMAELRGEEVEWSILAKADSLEDSLSPDDLISELGRAA